MKTYVLKLILFSALLLAACSAEPTPLPITPPTDTPAPTVEGDTGVIIPFDLRIALAPNMIGAVPAADLAALRAAGQVDQLQASVDPASYVGASADLYVEYGDGLTGGTVAPTRYQVIAVINSSLAPLDDSAVATILRELLANSAASLTSTPPADTLSVLRGRLANAGYPDGFNLTLGAVDAYNVEQIRAGFSEYQIDVIRTDMAADAALAGYANDELHLVIVGYTLDSDRAVWVERAGAENVIDLFSLPISYLAAPGITVSFSAGGYPVPGR